MAGKRPRIDWGGAVLPIEKILPTLNQPERMSSAFGLTFCRWLLVFEEPFVKFGVGVALGPRVVAGFGVDGELGVAAGFLHGVDHSFGLGKGDYFVLGAMEDPDGQAPNFLGE